MSFPDVDTDRLYVIIAGTTKAATTSFYRYLSDHPSICPSKLKETRYFLAEDYPLPLKFRRNKEIRCYDDFFDCPQDRKICLEATPDYLYSANTAQRIKGELAGAKLIFVLREPVSRLISYYKFARHLGLLSADMSFDDYVNLQRGECRQKISVRAHPAFQALQQGRYSVYLKPYFDLFDKNKICVAYYEQFLSDPLSVLTSICSYIGIESSFFRDYRFEAFNRSSNVSNLKLHVAYMKFKRTLRDFTYYRPAVRSMLRWVRVRLEPHYLKLNARTAAEETNISNAAAEFLREYYSKETAELTAMLGTRPPW